MRVNLASALVKRADTDPSAPQTREKSYAQAMSELDLAIGNDPTFWIARQNRRMILLKAGRYQEAQKEFEKILL